MIKKFIWLIIPLILFIFLKDLILYNKIPLASDMVAHEPIKEWISTTSEVRFLIGSQTYFLDYHPMADIFTPQVIR